MDDMTIQVRLGELRTYSGSLGFTLSVGPSGHEQVHIYASDNDGRKSGVFLTVSLAELSQLEKIISNAREATAKLNSMQQNAKPAIMEQADEHILSEIEEEAASAAAVDALKIAHQEPFPVPPPLPKTAPVDGPHEALFKLLCCVSLADGQGSAKQLACVRKNMERVKCDWGTEEYKSRYMEFIDRLNLFGFERLSEEILEGLSVFKTAGHATALLTCVKDVANADDILTSEVKDFCNRVRLSLAEHFQSLGSSNYTQES